MRDDDSQEDREGTPPPPRRPSLRQAKVRSQRAAVRLREIGVKLEEWVDQNVEALQVTISLEQARNPDEGIDAQVDWSRSVHIPTMPLSLLTGEVLYHARCSLDYLVYNLAWLDSGQEQKRTQFPIETSSKAFWNDARKQRLRGVSDRHAKQVAKYQPFNGCDWTKTLQDLSNRDKHRLIVSVTPRYEGGFGFELPEDENDWEFDDEGDVIVSFGSTSAEVVLVDGRPLFDTLGQIVTGVAKMLYDFQSSFGEADKLIVGSVAPLEGTLPAG